MPSMFQRPFAPSLAALALAALSTAALPVQAAAPVHNVILFVADGLRSQMVRPDTAPTMDAVRRAGVFFENSHSLFPTFTTPNASAMATGHYLGDTGDFSNTIYVGYPVSPAGGTVTPFLESDPVLGDVDEHFAGNYLDEETLLAAARMRGYSTAAVGKLGPVSIQDVTAREGEKTVVVDDSTGHPGGIPLAARWIEALKAAQLPTAAPGRGANGAAGTATVAGTHVANVEQQKYFTDVVGRAILPAFKKANKPFVMVFWSRDPDGTQHNQGDSLGQLVPGINGPTSLAAIRNADDNLAAIMAALETLGLDKTTDVFITSDHGFSTISKTSKTSPSARARYADVPEGQLPPGFLALDLAHDLGLPLADPDAHNAPINLEAGRHPSHANGVLGSDPLHPDLVVAANGGSDLVYLPGPNARELAPRVVKSLLAEDYVSGVFVDDAFGPIDGTLPLSAIGLKGSALTPVPSIVVNFTSVATGCPQPTTCTAEVADTGLQQGQGMHGSFSRADTYNFMAAVGPDFRSGFVDPAPASNADVGKTLEAILHLDVPNKGKLVGRVLTEARPSGKVPSYRAVTQRSTAGANGALTILDYQVVGTTRYFDAAGAPGRTVGLKP